MQTSHRSTHPSLAALWLAAAMVAVLALLLNAPTERLKAKGLRRSGLVQTSVILAPAAEPVKAAERPALGFAAQTRLGFTTGDQWEPAIAADRQGHVYVLYPQYLGVPGCPDCPSPTMILQVSRDRGATWGTPRQIAPPGTGQWDAQIAVDPVDGSTVYAAWLQDGKSDIAVAKSTDFGATWSVVIANSTNAATDKPILAVRGQDVYVAYNHAQKIWVSSSHDGGATFTSVDLNKTGKLVTWGLSSATYGLPDSATCATVSHRPDQDRRRDEPWAVAIRTNSC